jgi:hypothetical protein
LAEIQEELDVLNKEATQLAITISNNIKELL